MSFKISHSCELSKVFGSKDLVTLFSVLLIKVGNRGHKGLRYPLSDN